MRMCVLVRLCMRVLSWGYVHILGHPRAQARICILHSFSLSPSLRLKVSGPDAVHGR